MLVGVEFRLVDMLVKALEVLVEQPGFNLVYGVFKNSGPSIHLVHDLEQLVLKALGLLNVV